MTATPSADALLAAMEAAARELAPLTTRMAVKIDDLLQLCAALRASQEREAQAVAALEELETYRDAAMYDVKMDGAVFSHWNRSQLERARAMTEVARKDAAP